MTALNSSPAHAAGAPQRPAATNPDARQDLALIATHLTRTYGQGQAQVHALKDCSLSIRAGEFTAIVGASGSGKSTLMHCLAGLDRPDPNPESNILIGGVDITRLSDDQCARLRRTQVGFIFQSYNLVPVLTAKANIELPFVLAGQPVDGDRLMGLATRLGIAERLGHRPAELSGGQAQRVAIARALLPHPQVVLADEPTGALDSVSSAQVLELLTDLAHEEGQTVVVITHDPAVAAAADRVLTMRDGQIVGDTRA